MKKIVEILIVIIVLFGLALVLGCKDEVEAYEPEEPRGITFVEPIVDSIRLTDPNGGITISMASEIEVIEPSELIITDDQQKITEWQESFHYEPIEICNHENRIVCTVGGCGCWTCMDCGEHLEGYKIYFKDE